MSSDEIEIPEAARARAAAYVITASEGATLHLERLRTRARDFDPAVRDRLIAGAMIPAPYVTKAQKFRRWYREQVLALFADVDAILAPATPCTAPADRPADLHPRRRRAAMCAPISASTPSRSRSSACRWWRCRCRSHPLPIGVQIIAAPWREDIALRIAHALEQAGVGAATRPSLARTSARARANDKPMDIDLPDVVAEVTAAFERYERALVANDVATLNSLFRDDPRTIRYGVGENLYGYDEIKAFRGARSPVGLARTLLEDGHHHLWARFGRRLDAVSPRRLARQDRPPDADLGPVCGRLADRGGACQHDRRTIPRDQR